MAYRDYQLGKSPEARVPAQTPAVENEPIVDEIEEDVAE
jgi:hypothetical protein